MNNTMNNTVIIIDEEKQKKEPLKNKDEDIMIDNINDFRRFLNKGKLQEKFFYKIGDEESFERVTADFFLYCEDKGIRMKKNTVETRFLAYLKPKWESDQDRRDMIQAFERKKRRFLEPLRNQEKHVEEYKKDIQKAKEIEKTLTDEEKKILLKKAEERTKNLIPGIKENVLNVFSKSFYYKEILNIKNKSE